MKLKTIALYISILAGVLGVWHFEKALPSWKDESFLMIATDILFLILTFILVAVVCHFIIWEFALKEINDRTLNK